MSRRPRPRSPGRSSPWVSLAVVSLARGPSLWSWPPERGTSAKRLRRFELDRSEEGLGAGLDWPMGRGLGLEERPSEARRVTIGPKPEGGAKWPGVEPGPGIGGGPGPGLGEGPSWDWAGLAAVGGTKGNLGAGPSEWQSEGRSETWRKAGPAERLGDGGGSCNRGRRLGQGKGWSGGWEGPVSVWSPWVGPTWVQSPAARSRHGVGLDRD